MEKWVGSEKSVYTIGWRVVLDALADTLLVQAEVFHWSLIISASFKLHLRVQILLKNDGVCISCTPCMRVFRLVHDLILHCVLQACCVSSKTCGLTVIHETFLRLMCFAQVFKLCWVSLPCCWWQEVLLGLVLCVCRWSQHIFASWDLLSRVLVSVRHLLIRSTHWCYTIVPICNLIDFFVTDLIWATIVCLW